MFHYWEQEGHGTVVTVRLRHDGVEAEARVNGLNPRTFGSSSARSAGEGGPPKAVEGAAACAMLTSIPSIASSFRMCRAGVRKTPLESHHDQSSAVNPYRAAFPSSVILRRNLRESERQV